ncbi:hypothetical protein QTQ03_17755 [Micromonospora sp. WMMA1363]|uniref:hypothetical protein n=1 Tax=Micromonospora sp. WMMA1363 TaxID=3053985 RepID=UPI00259C9482|nr:hypothetical protein [Micromonospora sp. WMMA1363]MDM4721357.1 hypothetical protein [Micromonospora sp. WMMA1363]
MAELILLANPTGIAVHTPNVSLSVKFDSIAELKSWLHLAGLNDPDMLIGEHQGTADDGRSYRSMNAYPTWHGWEFYATATEYPDAEPLDTDTADRLTALAVA